MDVVDKLLRLLKDDFKVGVEMHSSKPVIYIDPNKFDQWRMNNDDKRSDYDAVSQQVANQLNEQYPGLSENFTQRELVELTKASLGQGPFARKVEAESSICLINQSKGNELKSDQINTTFGLTATFTADHLRKLPGTDAEWAQLIGEHEGEHCNQASVYMNDPLANAKMLDGETRSDRAALATLRAAGKEDMVTAFKAIRAIAAANGDDTHATSIFLDDEGFDGATKEHFEAAETFRTEMSMGVAESLGISVMEAESLRTADPQKYAKTAGDALKEGKIPVLRNVSEDQALALVTKELGEKDGSDANKQDAKQFNDIYQRLKSEGALQNHGPENPHVNKYIQNYVEAVKVLFVEDTTPSLQAGTAAPAETVPEEYGSEEEEAKMLDDAMKQDAKFGSGRATDELVGKALGLDDDGIYELFKADPDKYYNTAEQEIQKDGTSFQTYTDRPLEEVNGLIAKKLEVPVEKLKESPPFVLKMARSELQEAGAIEIKRDNPYLKTEIQTDIEAYRLQKDANADVKASAPADEAPETSDETLQLGKTPLPDSAPASAPAQASGKYSYLMSNRPDDGKGIPQIDLRSEDRGQMKIGCMSACEYFATKADPVLAAAATAPSQGAEIKDPTLAKVAQTTPSYLNTGPSSMQA